MSVAVERDAAQRSRGTAAQSRPIRLGFAGVGWIGRNRMRALTDSGHVTTVVVYDPAPDALAAALADAPAASGAASFGDLLEHELDGLVIATPSALHAEQATAALERGIAVFCQKPLARTAAETRSVISAAQKADRLLDVDLSYRHTRGMQVVRDLIARGELGSVYAADLVFHNGYGPDKPWFYDPRLSGGGCLMDLGVHLVDLALWTLGFPRVRKTEGAVYSHGELLEQPVTGVEDFATVQLTLSTTATVRFACSWKLAVGADALIEATFHGTRGGASFRNVNGSFHDFEVLHYEGTRATRLAEPPDDWGGRAAVNWFEHLRTGGKYDPAVEHVLETARTLDAVYGR